MGLVHELEELVDDRLEKLPVGLEEARVLADDVHDVAGHHGLVILASFHLRQAEQLLDDGDEESLLGVLGHGTGDGSDGPTEGVAIDPRPFRTTHLPGQLFGHDVLRVDDV